jgi:iron complex outermembrane recepter protein
MTSRLSRPTLGVLSLVLLAPGFVAGVATAATEPAPPLDEVYVTARKVREDIAAVPMSVQRLSGEHLERRGLSSLYELQFEVPGLVVNNRGMFGAGLALRGVTDEGGSSLSIAPHVNGVYLGSSNLALARMFDVERIEIVKGPQGTLYGRNATGGTINVVTRVPQREFDAAVELATGSFDTTRVQGHVDLPAGRHAARIAVVASRGDGFIRNSVDARRFAAEDYGGARVTLHGEPGAALRFDLMLQRVEDDGASGELWLPRKDQLSNPRDIRLTTVTLADPYLRTTNDLATLDASYELGSRTLRSVTGYARNLTHDRDDCAGVPPLRGCVRSVQPLRVSQFSQELRLESAAADRLAWTLGAYYLDGRETTRYSLLAPRLAPAPLNDYDATADETAYALFGQATHALTTHWRLEAGLRLSRERRRAAKEGRGVADEPGLAVAADSRDDTSWRLALQYSPREQFLAYASVATGFKSGGITADRLPDGTFDRYDSEQLLAYEAGIHYRAADRPWSLRASAFAYDFTDLQVATTRLLANQVATDIDNAAAARIHGLDLVASATMAGGLSVSGGLVWMPRREFVKFVDDLTGDALSGNVLSRAPRWSAVASLGYRRQVARLGEFSAELDYQHRSRFFFTKENDPLLDQRAFGLLNLTLRLDSADRRRYVFASGRNLLDTDYFEQVFLQSAPGRPAHYELGIGWRF